MWGVSKEITTIRGRAIALVGVCEACSSGRKSVEVEQTDSENEEDKETARFVGPWKGGMNGVRILARLNRVLDELSTVP